MGQIEVSGNAEDKYLKMQRSQLTGEAKWQDIEDLINRWANRDKQGALLLERWIRGAINDLPDKQHGKLRNEGLAGGRVGIIIHPDLEAYIKAFYPDFLSTKKELHEFMKRFPKFKVRERV